jgi:hypothetical protein
MAVPMILCMSNSFHPDVAHCLPSLTVVADDPWDVRSIRAVYGQKRQFTAK